MSLRRRAVVASIVPVAAALGLTVSLASVGPVAAGALAGPHNRTIAVVAAGKSNNWSGYNQGVGEKGTLFKSVSGEWIVPRASYRAGGPTTENSATWVGIGGGCIEASCSLTDPTSLIQAGTEQDVSQNGTTSYSAWWEIVPVPSITVSSVTVHAGDLVQVSITQTVPEVWLISLQDVSDSQGFTQTVPYPSTMLTAEWIEESPVVVGTQGAGLASLPNLTPVHFDAATVNGNNAQLTSAEQIQMTDASGNVIATPSSPDATNDDGFDDCAYATSCAAPSTELP
ncbi:MAG: G1 family glutamic endopeptidase [Acidimicrobiales bacterium]